MAKPELCFQVNLGHRAAELMQIEERIVAESAGPARGFQDGSFDCSGSYMEYLPITRGSENASIARGAFFCWYAFEFFEQQDIVPNVCVVEWGVGRIGKASVRCEAGRTHAGSTAECIDFEAGIISEDDFCGCEAGVMDGLEDGVFFEGDSGFLGSGNGGEYGEWFDFYVECLRGSGEITEFALTGGGGIEDGHGYRLQALAAKKAKRRQGSASGHRDFVYCAPTEVLSRKSPICENDGKECITRNPRLTLTRYGRSDWTREPELRLSYNG